MSVEAKAREIFIFFLLEEKLKIWLNCGVGKFTEIFSDWASEIIENKSALIERTFIGCPRNSVKQWRKTLFFPPSNAKEGKEKKNKKTQN